jgi:amino acid/amide ABC transporter ATP-binding protein 1, HAAT family (TC 3.A.1.4.-)
MSAPKNMGVNQQPAVAATGSDREAILSTRQLTKKFGGLTAVDSVGFTVAAGEIRCLIGPNGAGKSTLLELITGQLSPTQGDIYFDGLDLTRLNRTSGWTPVSASSFSHHIFMKASPSSRIFGCRFNERIEKPRLS